jgi:DNA-binding transcriptional MerR regulator
MSRSSVNAGTALRIGELAAHSGASRRSLRYYESQGLLRAQRGPNGYRYYDVRSVAVVQRIKELLSIGLPTRVVRTILPCVLDAHSPDFRCPVLRQTLREELERLDDLAADVNTSRQRIGALLDAATS